MKKTLLTIALVSSFMVASAQDMMSKKGTPILPEANDWSIGISVNPFFEYFGNMMNGSTNNSSPTFDFTNSDQIIVGKMMIDENTAYRAKIRLGFGSQTWNNVVDKDGSTTNETVTDELSTSSMHIALGAGKQWYRGKGRLRGFYGAEAYIMLGSHKDSYTYGNALTNAGATSTTVWDLTSGSYNHQSQTVGSRTTEEKEGSTFGFGIRGFIGAEYFFAPKMSVSGEFGWGLGLASTGEGESAGEFWNGSAVETSSSPVGERSSFGLDTDNVDGSIMLSFYF